MRQLDAFAVGRENHRVLADDVASPQAGETDVAASARAGMAVAGADAVVQSAGRGYRLRAEA